ncbi:type IV secretion system DNA-binding domain-containing protein [Nakamurella panacisegetis]|uniref:type IV secretion system DNA-binding domain-containing protein n=1 Tax=Nakamurella panacisegetis TaxID=1090615 RepID=UPI002F90D8E8
MGQFLYPQDEAVEWISLAEFVAGWNTLFIIIRHERAKAVQPLVTALVEAVTAAWRKAAATRRDGTLLLALDEVANVAPLPHLPTLLTAGAGDGIQCALGMQEPGQSTRW